MSTNFRVGHDYREHLYLYTFQGYLFRVAICPVLGGCIHILTTGTDGPVLRIMATPYLGQCTPQSSLATPLERRVTGDPRHSNPTFSCGVGQQDEREVLSYGGFSPQSTIHVFQGGKKSEGRSCSGKEE